MTKLKILLADPDSAFTEQAQRVLQPAGFELFRCADAAGCVKLLPQTGTPEMIFLAYSLPDMSGCTLCRQLREKHHVACPIIFLADTAAPRDTIKGLSSGADNFLSKPISDEELLARVRAQVRSTSRITFFRASSAAPPNEELEEELTVGQIRLLPRQELAYLDGRLLSLTPREYRLLAYFCTHPNVVVSRETLFETVWHSPYGDSRTVTVTIKKLRDKLGTEHQYIQTIWGVGYVFSPPPTDPHPISPFSP